MKALESISIWGPEGTSRVGILISKLYAEYMICLLNLLSQPLSGSMLSLYTEQRRKTLSLHTQDEIERNKQEELQIGACKKTPG